MSHPDFGTDVAQKNFSVFVLFKFYCSGQKVCVFLDMRSHRLREFTDILEDFSVCVINMNVSGYSAAYMIKFKVLIL